MKYLLLISALSLSCIAAYFSIIGLSTIFPGSIQSIIIMAVSLEIAKIVVAVWTHQNWKKISILTRVYLCFSVFILMGITSAGIFGFLSKSHIEHSSSIAFSENVINEIDRKIELENESIARQKKIIEEKKSIKNFSETKNQKVIDQLSQDITTIYSRLDIDIGQTNEKIDKFQARMGELDKQLQDLRSQKTGLFSSNTKKIKALEDSQKEERLYISNQLSSLNESIIEYRKSSNNKVDELRKEINEIQNSKIEIEEEDLNLISTYEEKIKLNLLNIENLNLKKFELESKNLQIENELGPVKYIAELIKDFGGPDLNTAGSIRLVIIFIVCVFDPLAIVMVICASNSFRKPKKNKTLNQTIAPESNDPDVGGIKLESEDPKSQAQEVKPIEGEPVLIKKGAFAFKAPKNKT